MTKANTKAKTLQTKAMPAALDAEALNKAIGACHGAMQKVQDTIQVVGVQALLHLAKCGDIGPANRLVMGMPQGARKLALTGWLLSHGALSLNMDAADRKERLFVYDKAKKTDAEAAWADAWHEHQPEKKPEDVFDLSRALASIIRKIGDHPIKINGKELTGKEREQHISMLKAIYNNPQAAPVPATQQ